jgi:hypothetical protein
MLAESHRGVGARYHLYVGGGSIGLLERLEEYGKVDEAS